MSRTYPEHELPLMAVFGPVGCRHWSVVELRGRIELVLIRISGDQAEDVGRPRTLLLPDVHSLVAFLDEPVDFDTTIEIACLMSHRGAWRFNRVAGVMVAEEPNTLGTAHILHFESGETCVLSPHGTAMEALSAVRSIFGPGTDRRGRPPPTRD
jgi:hypothetical protein